MVKTRTSIAGGMGSVPGRGAKIQQAGWHSIKRKGRNRIGSQCHGGWQVQISVGQPSRQEIQIRFDVTVLSLNSTRQAR